MSESKQILTVEELAQQLEDFEMEIVPKLEESIVSLDMLNNRLSMIEDQTEKLKRNKYGLRPSLRKRSSALICYRW